MQLPLIESQIQILLKSSNYRGFLQSYLVLKKEYNSNFSLDVFRKKTGFKSKGHIHDIISGRKRISNTSLNKFSRALTLSHELKSYFKTLVYLEEADTRPMSWKKTSKLQERIKSLETQILNSSNKKNIPINSIKDIHVLCALGDEMGADIEEICQRTQFSQIFVSKALRRLLDHKIISMKSNKYLLDRKHSFYSGQSSELFQNLYLDSLKTSLRHAKLDFNNKSKLFYLNNFSISSKDKERLIEELKEIINSYVVRAECSTGDKISTLSLSFI